MSAVDHLIIEPPVDAEVFEIFPGITLPVAWYKLAKSKINSITPVSAFDCLSALVLSRDVEAMQSYFAQGGVVNLRAADGQSLINYALKSNDYAPMINLLLDQPNFDVNFADGFYETPVFFAIRHQPLEVLEKILGMNPDINLTNSKSMTPLMYAVTENHEIFNAIMQKNPKIFTKNRKGESAITYALRNNRREKSKELLSCIQADQVQELEAKNNRNWYFLGLAAQNLNAKMFQDILDVYKRCQTMPSANHLASTWSALAPFINERMNNKTPEQQKRAALEITQKLVNEKADINVILKKQRTPLIILIRRKHWNATLFLLAQAEIQVGTIDDNRWNALCHVMQWVKESRNNEFELMKQEANAVYQQLLTKMSDFELQHTVAQMNVTLLQLRTDSLDTLRQIFHPPAAFVLDLQSTHRRTVHQSTAWCAEVLSKRYPAALEPQNFSVAMLAIKNIFLSPSWITTKEKTSYIRNIENTLRNPIPGDANRALETALRSKLDWMNTAATVASAMIERLRALKTRYNAISVQTEKEELSREYRALWIQCLKTDWASLSCNGFLNLVFYYPSYSAWREPTCGRSLGEVFVLLWTAINDPQYELTSEQKKAILTQVGLAMIDAFHEGGAMHPCCAPGMFNAMMDSAARSGLIPGLYVLANASESGALKQQLAQKLSVQAYFDSLNAEQRAAWFESDIAYDQAKANIAKEYNIFMKFGENEVFKIFTSAELQGFESELTIAWGAWGEQHKGQCPTLENLMVSRLKGMSQAERLRCLKPQKRKMATSSSADTVPNALGKRRHIMTPDEESSSEELDALRDGILSQYPTLCTASFDRVAIVQAFGSVVYSLIDYTTQSHLIQTNPTGWVNTRWSEYYMTLDQEALNNLLPQVQREPTGNFHQDLLVFATIDRERVFVQCGLNAQEGVGKILADDYQVWLDQLKESVAPDQATPMFDL